MKKNLKSIASKIITVGAIGVGAYCTSHLAVGAPQFFSERIRDESHLKQVIDEEKNKLGMKNAEIYIAINKNPSIKDYLIPASALGYTSRTTGKKIGYVAIHSPWGMRRGIVKHELAHIANEDRGINGLQYWTQGEFLANLYGSFEVDLNKDSRVKLRSVSSK